MTSAVAASAVGVGGVNNIGRQDDGIGPAGGIGLSAGKIVPIVGRQHLRLRAPFGFAMLGGDGRRKKGIIPT